MLYESGSSTPSRVHINPDTIGSILCRCDHRSPFWNVDYFRWVCKTQVHRNDVPYGGPFRLLFLPLTICHTHSPSVMTSGEISGEEWKVMGTVLEKFDMICKDKRNRRAVRRTDVRGDVRTDTGTCFVSCVYFRVSIVSRWGIYFTNVVVAVVVAQCLSSLFVAHWLSSVPLPQVSSFFHPPPASSSVGRLGMRP